MRMPDIAVAISAHCDEKPHILAGVNMARAFHVPLRFIHVTASMMVITGYSSSEIIEIEIEENDPCRAEDSLEKYVLSTYKNDITDIQVHYEVLRGDSVNVLVEYTRDIGCLILGHHHLNGFMHGFINTVDEKVLNQAQCPVMLIPE